jgi:hypothetical protein
MEDRRYCINCKYVKVPPHGMEYARCNAPTVRRDGTEYLSPDFEVKSLPYASLTRKNEDKCGPEGRWWVPITVGG